MSTVNRYAKRWRPKQSIFRRAEAAVEEAIGIEGKHNRSFGGHRHQGAVHPLLNDDNFPLPVDWRKP